MFQPAERFEAVRADFVGDRFYASDMSTGGHADDSDDHDYDDDDEVNDDTTGRRCRSAAFSWTRQLQ